MFYFLIEYSPSVFSIIGPISSSLIVSPSLMVGMSLLGSAAFSCGISGISFLFLPDDDSAANASDEDMMKRYQTANTSRMQIPLTIVVVVDMNYEVAAVAIFFLR